MTSWTSDNMNDISDSKAPSMTSAAHTRSSRELCVPVVSVILDGRQPIDLNVERLKKVSTIPADWNAQRQQLGFVGQP